MANLDRRRSSENGEEGGRVLGMTSLKLRVTAWVDILQAERSPKYSRIN